MDKNKFKKYFSEGDSIKDFELTLGEKKRLHELHYKKFSPSEIDVNKLISIGKFNIIVITEPWCGDSLAIFPVFKKMAEINDNWNIKVSYRDENIELIDEFLTKGGRAIPIFLFLDSDFNLKFKWGPRSETAQKIYEKKRNALKKGEVEKIDVIKDLRKFYAKDRGDEILKEILMSIENVNK